MRLLEEFGGEFYLSKEKEIAHMGAIPSSSAYLSTFLDNGFTIAVMSNNGRTKARQIRNAIVDHMLRV